MTKKTSSLPREVIARCWCSKVRKRFGLVLERKSGQLWEIRHAYSISESYEEAECHGLNISGTVGICDAYNGCKWCADKRIFQCGQCQAFNCQAHEREDVFRCANCGNAGILSGTIRSFSSAND
jgi:hypothetical protein